MLSFLPRDVLDEIWDLIVSVSEGFPTYSFYNLGAGFSREIVYFNSELSEIFMKHILMASDGCNVEGGVLLM